MSKREFNIDKLFVYLSQFHYSYHNCGQRVDQYHISRAVFPGVRTDCGANVGHKLQGSAYRMLIGGK